MMTVNGHCTYLPGNTLDPERHLSGHGSAMQNPYLYDVATGKRSPLGHFRSPPEYTGEWRCDTHPRFSPDGRKVVIDSPHGGRAAALPDRHFSNCELVAGIGIGLNESGVSAPLIGTG